MNESNHTDDSHAIHDRDRDLTDESSSTESDNLSFADEPVDPARYQAVVDERDELKDKYLRVLADYQNFSRRAAQNIDSAREETRMQLARSLISVMDHFDRAIESDTEKMTVADVLHGVRIVRDELLKTLEQFGVRRLDAEVGGEFDPNVHDALMRQSVEGIGPDRIAQQLQPGYTLGDKTLRPAKVTVTE